MKMTANEVRKLYDQIPRVKYAFLPTPFHKLENISKDTGVNIYVKREDMTGPSNLGGNKVRKLEFIMGEAVKQGYDTMISVGAYQTNSAMEFVQFCNLLNIKPIVFVADIHDNGIPTTFDEIQGNLRLMKIMGADVRFVGKTDEVDANRSYLVPMWDRMYREVAACKAELEAQGHKVWEVPSGCANDFAMVSYVLSFVEMMEQSEAMGVKLDYIYNTQGTGGSLPGMIAGKYLMGSDVEFRPIGCAKCEDEDICGPTETVRRVKLALESLNVEAPSDEWIRSQINIDPHYYGEDYGYPTPEAVAAIRYLAKREAIFTDTVYTGKGFSGLLDHIKQGKIPQGSNVCFVHTGGTGALFAKQDLIGDVFDI